MNLADFPCFSLFFLCLFSLCDLSLSICGVLFGVTCLCIACVWIFIHFKLELIRMRRGTYFFILCSLSKCFHRRSGWKEYRIFCFFQLEFTNILLLKTPLPNTWLVLLWFGYLDMMDNRFCHFCLIVSIFYGVKKWSPLLVMMNDITINLYGVHLTSFTRVADR